MKWSLRWRISMVFILAVILVTAISTAVAVNQGRSQIRDAFVERQERAGVGAATALEAFLDSSGKTLASTASLLEASDLRPGVDTRAVSTVLNPVVAYSEEFTALLLLDSEGQTVLARPEEARWINATFGDQAAYEQARSTPGLVLSLEANVGPPYWVTGVPATHNTTWPYFLVGLLNMNRVKELLFLYVPPETEAVLVDRGGAVLTTTDPAITSPSLADWAAWQALSAGRALAVEDQAPTSEKEVLATSTHLSTFPGEILLLGSAQLLRAPQQELIRNAVIIAMGLSGAALLLGVFVTNQIVKPVAEVRTATRRMSEGDLSVRTKARGAPELRELAQDFNTMAANLARDRQELMQLQRHLEALVEKRTTELREKREEMELFFYGVSHDMKSPVIAISNFGQMLEETLTEHPTNLKAAADLVARIRRSSANLRALVLELLEFARAEQAKPSYKVVDAANVLGSVIEEAEPFARERGVRLEKTGGSLRMVADPDRLRHIAVNLVQNAIKFMPPDKRGWVRVRWHPEGAEFVLQVQDNGAGIPPVAQARIFRPFQHHAHAGVEATGSGLGLSIVHRLVASLGGRVTLESREAWGTIFTVRLPMTPPSGVRVGS